MDGSFGVWRKNGKLIPSEPIGQTSHYCNFVSELAARAPGQWAAVRDDWNAVFDKPISGENSNLHRRGSDGSAGQLMGNELGIETAFRQ